MARKQKKTKAKTSKVKQEAQEQIRKVQAAAERRARELQDQIEAAEEEERKAKEEDEKLYLKTVDGIGKLAEDGGYFVGVTLTHNDILAIVDLAMRTKESIKIPYRLYDKDDGEMILPPDNSHSKESIKDDNKQPAKQTNNNNNN